MVVVTGDVKDAVVEQRFALLGQNQFRESLERHGGEVIGGQRQLKDISIQNQRRLLGLLVFGDDFPQAVHQLLEDWAWLGGIDARAVRSQVSQQAIAGSKVHV
jgi:hypothetical protein